MFDIVSDLHFDNGMAGSPRGILGQIFLDKYKNPQAKVLIVAGDSSERQDETALLLNGAGTIYERVIGVWGNHEQPSDEPLVFKPTVVVLDEVRGYFAADRIAYVGGCPLDARAEDDIIHGYQRAQIDQDIDRVVLITHLVPSFRFSQIIGRDIDNKAIRLLERLTFMRKPTLLVFGHVHLRFEGEIDGMRFLSNPRGYKGKLRDRSDWRGKFLFEP